MICSSRAVPSVATTKPCVSPRVNKAEPCARGSTLLRMVIGRTVRVSRPSMRGSPLRICPRTIFDSSAKQISPTALASGPPSLPTPTASCTRFQMSSIAAERACFCLIWKAAFRSFSATSLIRAASASSFAGAAQSHSGLPAASTSS